MEALRPIALRAVLFDAMGTLVALEDPVDPLRRELRQRFGLELASQTCARALREEIAFYRAHHDEATTAARLTGLRRRCAAVLRDGLGDAARTLSLDELAAALMAALSFRALPDAAPVLGALRARGLRTVVVSNWDCALEDVLLGVGLRSLLDGVVTSAQVGASKPEPAIFRHALELARAAPNEALHVGDRRHEDVTGARAAGIAVLLLDRDATAAAAPGTIRSLHELVAHLS